MRKAVSLLLLVPMLVGCSPEKPTGGASPTPSASSTTPASSPQSPTAQVSADPSQDPLYLEAVTVYRAYFAELTKAEMSGFKPKSLSPMIDPYVTGTMKDVVEKGYQVDRSSGLIFQGAKPPRIERIAPNPGVSRGGSVTSLRACVNATHLTVIERSTGKTAGQGILSYKEIYFTKTPRGLIAFAQDSKRVSACPLP